MSITKKLGLKNVFYERVISTLNILSGKGMGYYPAVTIMLLR